MNQITSAAPFGDLLRAWRERRRYSQLALAVETEISQRHISFLESGRSCPSRQMVLRLSEFLDVPLRDRNTLLLAAGHAPAYSELPMEDPSMGRAREAIDLVLRGHEPYPAIVVDRHWTMVGANNTAQILSSDVAPVLLEPPVNAVRLTLHPEGVAPRIVNLGVWKAHLVMRLRRQFELTRDPVIQALLEEVITYPPILSEQDYCEDPTGMGNPVMLPLVLSSEIGELSFFGTTTVFGSAVEVTLSELALEAFYPADEKTKAYLRQLEEGAAHKKAKNDQ